MKRATMKWGTWVPLVERLRGSFGVRFGRTEPSGHWPEEHPGPIIDRPEATQGATGGWTLTEVMVTVAIVGIMATVAPPMFVQFQRFYFLTDARTQIQRDARHTLSVINRFLRQAKSLTIVIDQVSGQPPYSRITFTTVKGTDFQYYQEGSLLYQKVGSNTVPISKNLKYIAFTFPRSDDPTIISVSITMEKASYEGGKKALELSIEKVRVMN